MRQLLVLFIFATAFHSFTYAAGNGPGITIIKVEKDTVKPYEIGAKDDKGIRVFKITITLSKKITKDISLTLTLDPNSTRSVPVLLDTTIIVKKELFKKDTCTFTVRVQLKQIDCLPSDESFLIGVEETSVKKNKAKAPKSTVTKTVTISKIPLPDPPTILIVPGITVQSPYLKADSTKGIRNFMIPVRLSGRRDLAKDSSIEFVISENIPSNSNPKIITDVHQTISKNKFDPLGCPVIVNVPVSIQLSTVDNFTEAENILILLRATATPNFIMKLVADNQKPVTQGQPIQRTTAIKTDSFTYACSSIDIYFKVVIRHDSSGGIVDVYKDSTKKFTSFLYKNDFPKENFAAWLWTNYIKKVTNPSCGVCKGCAEEFAQFVETNINAVNDITSVKLSAAKTNDSLPKTVTDKSTASDTANPKKDSKSSALALIHLDNKETRINPIYVKDSSEPKIISIIIIRDSAAKVNDSISLVVEKLQFPYDPKIINPNPLVLEKNKWVANDPKITGDTSKAKFYQKVELYIKNPFVDSLTADVSAAIKIKGGDESFHVIRLTEKGLYIDRSFWAEMGVNFDLFDNIKTNNFYTGVFLFQKDAWNPYWKPFWRRRTKWKEKEHKPLNFSFTAGVYEAKATDFNVASDTGWSYRNNNSSVFNPSRVGYPIFHDSGTVNTSSSISSLGLFFSPHLRLNNRPTNENGFHIFISLYVELLWQKINTTFDYDKTRPMDTLYFPTIDGIYNYNFKESAKTFDYRSQYYGIGIPIYIKDNKFSFYFNPVVGVTNQKYLILQADLIKDVTEGPNYKPLPLTALTGLAQPKCTWNWFTVTQFRLTDEDIGITFTGDVRTLLVKNTKPVITLALSKKFDLASLYKALVKVF